MSRHDVIVAGGGHNGLVCAAYLARAGQRVLVLERRASLGGVLDVLPTVGGLAPEVVDELALARHGLELVRPPVSMLALRDGAAPLAFFASAARTAESLGADAGVYPRFDAHVRRLAGFLARMQALTPPRLGGRPAVADARGGLELAAAYRALGERDRRELTRALPMAAADFVGEWLGDDAVRGPLAARGTRFTAMGPWSAGTALALLWDAAASGAGAAGETVLVRGGPGALAGALAVAARSAGAEIRIGVEVERLVAEDGAVTGVVTSAGEELVAGAVVSAVDPKTALTRWLDPEVAGPQLRWRAGTIRTPGAAAVVELELERLPGFRGVEDPSLLRGRIVVAPGIDDVERAFDAWKYGELAERPYVEVMIPGLADGAAGENGGVTLRALVQWVPYASPADEVVRRVVAVLEPHAPGLGELVVEGRALTPADLEREYGLAGGHLHHGELALDQFFAWRPVLGLARYRLGVPGLYLCGSGAHPGGGVSGRPGRNAAREILRDLRRRP